MTDVEHSELRQDPSAMATMSVRDKLMRRFFDQLIVALKPTIICDIGALDGSEAARFVRLLPEGEVYLFEASVQNFNEFVKSRSDLRHTVLENAAVSDVDGVVSFMQLDASQGAANVWMRGAGSLRTRTDEFATAPIATRSVTLDGYFSQRLSERPTFMLWIDVEGAVDKVIAGAEAVLERTIALRVEVEYARFWAGQPLADDIDEALTQRGFVVVGDTFTDHALDQSDRLYVNRRLLGDRSSGRG